MIGQNVLLELNSGDKVQIYAYTSTGITDHKNSRYTQFIGVLLRPSTDVLSAMMKKLGNAEEMDEDVSIAEGSIRDVARRNHRNKNRVLSPGPQPKLPENVEQKSEQNGDAPPVRNEVHKNGNIPQDNGNIPREVSSKDGNIPQDTVPREASNGNIPQMEEAKLEPEPEKQHQSYLALTKLGMGKKTVDNNNNEQPPPKEKKKKNSEGKRKSMTEMASSTLKGFSKM